jgi:hypothetical protein
MALLYLRIHISLLTYNKSLTGQSTKKLDFLFDRNRHHFIKNRDVNGSQAK